MSDGQQIQGENAKLKECSLQLKLFQLTIHPNRIDYIVTNDHELVNASEDATKACGFRWKIERYHRETKKTTGIGKCQARNSKAQRKHIITAILAWIILSSQAYAKNMTIYALKNKSLKKFQALI